MGWTRRLVCGIGIVAGSALYALVLDPVIAVAAALSWPVFGVALLFVTKGKPSMIKWADACLNTMIVGILILSASTLLEAVKTTPLPVHLWVLVLSQLCMALIFLEEASRLSLRPVPAVALWLGVLDGSFLVFYGALS